MVDKYYMLAIDWQMFFFGEDDWSFIFEIMIRSAIMFTVSMFSIRLVGKHGIKQPLFEVVMIITLGSAAGDAMFYKDVGLIPAIMVFVMIVFMYQLVHYIVSKSPAFDTLIEGKPQLLVKEGRFHYPEFKKIVKAQDEFMPELRDKGVSQLGQIKYAILEDSGEISVFFYPDEEVKPGLPIFPWSVTEGVNKIREPGEYACACCGTTVLINNASEKRCLVCDGVVWIKANSDLRVQ